MYLQILIVLLVAASTTADDLCCYPPQYQVGFGANGVIKADSGAQLQSIFCNSSIDYDMRRTSSDCIVYSPSLSVFRIINAYDKNTAFLYLPSLRQSKLRPLENKLNQCIPDSKEIMELYFGIVKDVTFPVKNFEVNLDGHTVYATLGAEALETNDCSLVGITIINQANVMLETYGYFNYTVGIPDPSVLEIPSICPQDNLGQSESTLRFEDMKFHHFKKMPFL